MKRRLRRIGIALAALVVALTIASLAYNAATPGGIDASRLYAGPYVLVDGTKLAYRRWGTHGSAVVLLGGFVEPSWVWHDVGPLLGRAHRVYALDVPPFGYSQRHGPYTLARWTQLVQGFDDRLGIRRPVIVGHSLGAGIAVSVATEAPRSVSGIVLLDGDALPVGHGLGFGANLLVPPWYTTVYRIVTGSDWIVRRVLRGAWGSPHHFSAAFVNEFERPFRVSGTAAAFTSMLGHGIEGVSSATLAAVRIPALVVWGQKDTVDSVSSGRRTAAIMHVPFVEIPGAGHLSMLVRPALVARAIDRLLRR